ncbi:MAG: type VII secretion protein EssC, partial [Eubacteriaceae bacterium]|nr:type VII secretion protein EssC [Eubacteriaceae bacterium]
MHYLVIEKEGQCIEYPVTRPFKMGGAAFALADGNLKVIEKQNERYLPPFSMGETAAGNRFYFYDEWEKRVAREGLVTIAETGEDINIPGLGCQAAIQGWELYLARPATDQPQMAFYNGTRIADNVCNIRLKEGDTLFLNGTKLTVYNDQIAVTGNHDAITTELLEVENKDIPFEGFPDYKRSPRLIKKIPKDKLEIGRPPQKSGMKKGSLVQAILPSLVMLCVTIAVSVLMKRGLFILMSVAGMAMTMIFSVTKYIEDKKECKAVNARRDQLYTSYLLKKRKEIDALYKQEQEAYTYNYPTIEEIEAMVNGYSDRIYERSSNDDDFLRVSVGRMAESVSFHINMTYNELSMDEDPLEKEAYQLKQEFSIIPDKPVLVDLKKDHLGLVGEKDVVHEQLKLLVAQMTFEQSYFDLEMITIYDEQYDEDFEWMRWYPHLKLHSINVVANINTERKRDQILGSIHQILKERKLRLDESRKTHRFLPHLVFIIDEPKLIMDHSIMEYLDRSGDEMGFSIIYTTHLRANLPENIGTIVLLENSEQGVLLLKEKEIVNKKFRLNRGGQVDFEKMARNLGVLKHKQGIVSQIPESISFFEMYQVDRPEELDTLHRWKVNQSHKSLAVPLGVRAEEDDVRLNLHEKAHGPHGLIAGTTGSGKSELIQSYILSLAVNFHPYEVGFLLIDYKGGGMAGLFDNLPHLLGTITNLDGAESMRAMASIKSELARRQRYFQKYGVNHINAYNILFKNGEAKEPMPHLFLISDEFAELKKEQPEFMTELVSTARIGRSLGVHLILATQKPTGVVDDQIWTNSKFKIALKVQSESDSKEVLKTPDAAAITQPGRAYLQVGNNEIYELFQSAWSGAAYDAEDQEDVVDDRVYLVNDLGQGELVNEDLSGGSEEPKLQVTQLDATIDYIHDLFEQEGGVMVKRPWLPPLKEQILSPLMAEEKPKEAIPVADDAALDLRIPTGMMDIPEEQAQREYDVDLMKDGNFLYMASSGYGKSVLLTTMLISLALKNRVSAVNFYILDFGNSALIPLNGLPHTADYITVDARERFTKFINIINDELAERKKKLADLAVQNFQVYNQVAPEKLKAIVIAVDNFDVVKEFGFETEDFFSKLTRDGVGLGIYVIGTTTRS